MHWCDHIFWTMGLANTQFQISSKQVAKQPRLSFTCTISYHFHFIITQINNNKFQRSQNFLRSIKGQSVTTEMKYIINQQCRPTEESYLDTTNICEVMTAFPHTVRTAAIWERERKDKISRHSAHYLGFGITLVKDLATLINSVIQRESLFSQCKSHQENQISLN